MGNSVSICNDKTFMVDFSWLFVTATPFVNRVYFQTMARKREQSFSLSDAVKTPSFTPKKSDLEGLFSLLKDSDHKTALSILRVLERLPHDFLFEEIVSHLKEASSSVIPYALMLVGRLAEKTPEEKYRELLLSYVTGEDGKIVRYAVQALGKFPPSKIVEETLLQLLSRNASNDIRKVIIQTLGKVGHNEASLYLEKLTVSENDPALKVEIDRALLMLKRETIRSETPSHILNAVSPPRPIHLKLFCRGGLEKILTEEFSPSWQATAEGTGVVFVRLSEQLAELFHARTWTSAVFPLGLFEGTCEESVINAITSERAQKILSLWTQGPIRYRIAWADGGHRTSLTLSIAKKVFDKYPHLVNDPRSSPWEFDIYEKGPSLFAADLYPKGLHDPRFTYRVADIPAASNLTIAAALVRVAGISADDIVWDPFAGAGTELIERAIAGPYRRLIGTDIDQNAIDAAQKNVAAAKVQHIELSHQDALGFTAPSPTLIITNPPFGKRLSKVDVSKLLDEFFPHAVKQLVEGGRFVLMSPDPSRTQKLAQQNGLVLEYNQTVDMGGFSAAMQKFRKTAR